VEGRHHRDARDQSRDQADEERFEVVRVQQLNAVFFGGLGDGARAGQVEAALAVETNREQSAAARFVAQGIGRSGACDGADQGLVGSSRGRAEREHCPVRAVQRRALPQMQDWNHERSR